MKIIWKLAGVLSSFSALAVSFEAEIVENVNSYIHVPANIGLELNRLAGQGARKPVSDDFKGSSKIPLFKVYPELRDQIAHIHLVEAPTPIIEVKDLAQALEIKELFFKRDDQTGMIKSQSQMFGGNKVRKLEFLLADALNNMQDYAPEARAVLTFGCAGSNHALATAVYAKELGLNCISMLKPQHNSYVARRNLLLHHQTGAKMNLSPTIELHHMATIVEMLQHKQNYGVFPYIIPTGGSCPIGVLGFVNAAFELKEQIDAGIMPEPDILFVPLGSAGTYVGLELGIRALGLKTKIIPVTVEPVLDVDTLRRKVSNLFEQTNKYLALRDPSFPCFYLDPQEIELIADCGGEDYALFTPSGVEAIKLAKEKSGIQLDGVYTGKAFAGLIDYSNNHDLSDKVVLFWNTFCGEVSSSHRVQVDYRNLPHAFHIYFEEDVQPLDR